MLPRKVDITPRLMPHKRVAALCGITTDTLRTWVAKGNFPEPHSTIGKTLLYKTDLIEHWLQTGEWLPSATWKNGRREGRDHTHPESDASEKLQHH
jgi:predicted DNA-binding transcriptional regulator AlpA